MPFNMGPNTEGYACPYCGATGYDAFESTGISISAGAGYTCKSCYKTVFPNDPLAGMDHAINKFREKGYAWAWRRTFKNLFFVVLNPDVLLVLFSWLIAFVALFGSSTKVTIPQAIASFVGSTLFGGLAPVITVLFIRRLRSGLGLIKGWGAAFRSNWTLPLVLFGLIAAWRFVVMIQELI